MASLHFYLSSSLFHLMSALASSAYSHFSQSRLRKLACQSRSLDVYPLDGSNSVFSFPNCCSFSSILLLKLAT
ncbi:hypothetical protein EV426DRAFT_591566 [Tirmania nivea]|nr:hypothetical protein EV426DRAFT_591566 [Tirmania nivea]